MKYDERVCKFNMDTGCVELLLRDERKISIDCTGIEDALDVTMAQQTELDYLIYNDPLISVPSSIFLAVSYTNGAKKQKFQTFLNAILQRFNAMLQPWKMKIPSIKNL